MAEPVSAWGIDIGQAGLKAMKLRVSDDGERVIAHFGVKGIAQGPKFELIATNRLDEGIFWSSAAISGNQVLLRGQHHIYCIRK